MSIEAIAWAFTVDATPQERNVLFALALYANDETAECWPGLDTLQEMSNMDRRAVIRAINNLVKTGMIERVEKGHRGQSTRYLLKGVIFCRKSVTNDTRINRVIKLIDSDLVCQECHPIDIKSDTNDTLPPPEIPGVVGEFGIWLDVFTEITNIPENHISPKKAADAVKQMVEAGATPDDMRSGYAEVKDNYTILGPWSLVNPTTNAMRKRKGKNGNGHKAQKEEQFVEDHTDMEALRKLQRQLAERNNAKK
jgi:predicted transcriptional regulator